jgi:type II secretory pathway pseudopilin PulG
MKVWPGEEEMTQQRQDGSSPEAGFSMVELVVAMLITLIVSGAIYGMIVSGSNSFRREPAITDRQQNIRVAMDSVARDVMNAGNDIPAWVQLFTPGLNSIGTLVSPDANASSSHGGPNVDFLEILGNDGNCPNMDVCRQMNGVSMTTSSLIPGCFGLPGLVLVWSYGGDSAIMYGCSPGGGANSSCGAAGGGGGGGGGQGADNGHVVFPPGLSSRNPPGGPPFQPDGMSAIQVIRYEVVNDTDGVPVLRRSPVGGENPVSGGGGGQCATDPTNTSDGWMVIARGVEDMQVRYMSHGDYPSTWANTPSVLVADDHSTVIRQVEVTLRARTIGERALAGETTGANGATGIRGELRTVITPRNALVTLMDASPNPLYR